MSDGMFDAAEGNYPPNSLQQGGQAQAEQIAKLESNPECPTASPERREAMTTGIQLLNNFDGLCNCTYTTTGGETVHVDIAALMKVVSEIPDLPKIFTMKIDIKRSSLLPDNFILLSESVADALEQALKDKKP